MGKLLEAFAGQSAAVRFGVAASLLALVAGGYFYWLYLPKSEELARAQQVLAGLEAKVAESRRTAAELPRFKADVERLNGELVTALAQLPEAKEIPDLLAQVSRVGQDSGLDVLLFKPGAERSEGLYASIPVEIRTTGTFHQIVLFFDRVSRLPRIVTIGDVTLSDPKEANGRLGLAASFKATTYRFLPDGGAGGAGGAGAKGRGPRGNPSGR